MSPAATTTHGLSFRAKLVLGVCGLVLLTGAVVLWLAHAGARASTEALTGPSSAKSAASCDAHARVRSAPHRSWNRSAQLADKGLAVDDPDRLAPQLLAVLKANPGLSWVSYSDENGTFTGAYRAPEGGTAHQSQPHRERQDEAGGIRRASGRHSEALQNRRRTADTTRGSARSTSGRSKPAGWFGCRLMSSIGSGCPASLCAAR